MLASQFTTKNRQRRVPSTTVRALRILSPDAAEETTRLEAIHTEKNKNASEDFISGEKTSNFLEPNDTYATFAETRKKQIPTAVPHSSFSSKSFKFGFDVKNKNGFESPQQRKKIKGRDKQKRRKATTPQSAKNIHFVEQGSYDGIEALDKDVMESFCKSIDALVAVDIDQDDVTDEKNSDAENLKDFSLRNNLHSISINRNCKEKKSSLELLPTQDFELDMNQVQKRNGASTELNGTTYLVQETTNDIDASTLSIAARSRPRTRGKLNTVDSLLSHKIGLMRTIQKKQATRQQESSALNKSGKVSIQFCSEKQGKALVNRESMAVHKEKNKAMTQSKSLVDGGASNAFSFGFSFSTLLPGSDYF